LDAETRFVTGCVALADGLDCLVGEAEAKTDETARKSLVQF